MPVACYVELLITVIVKLQVLFRVITTHRGIFNVHNSIVAVCLYDNDLRWGRFLCLAHTWDTYGVSTNLTSLCSHHAKFQVLLITITFIYRPHFKVQILGSMLGLDIWAPISL